MDEAYAIISWLVSGTFLSWLHFCWSNWYDRSCENIHEYFYSSKFIAWQLNVYVSVSLIILVILVIYINRIKMANNDILMHQNGIHKNKPAGIPTDSFEKVFYYWDGFQLVPKYQSKVRNNQIEEKDGSQGVFFLISSFLKALTYNLDTIKDKIRHSGFARPSFI